MRTIDATLGDGPNGLGGLEDSIKITGGLICDVIRCSNLVILCLFNPRQHWPFENVDYYSLVYNKGMCIELVYIIYTD